MYRKLFEAKSAQQDTDTKNNHVTKTVLANKCR